MRAALDLIATRRIDVASMITHRFPLAGTAEAFRLMVEGGDSLKIIIQPQS
jgi:threonine dehydrogenase-like Zn-dependent dehydrogenase